MKYSCQDYSFDAPQVIFKTLSAKATSDRVALICAETNLLDEVTGTGFEWRRYDAPELVPSTYSPCPVVDGVLTGALRNLSASTYYMFRPYYEDEEGVRTYGEWSAFGTADAYVYFDPTVRTYAAAQVGDTSARLKGYAIAGSDDITEQGFEYWLPGSAAPKRTVAAEVSGYTGKAAEEFTAVAADDGGESDGVETVVATGQWMDVTLRDLLPGTTYAYRAFVRTAKGTTYGAEEQFTTTNTTGIAPELTVTPEADGKQGIFTLDGRRVDAARVSDLPAGIYIVNGKKLMVK